jgi:antirestriction protein ArdC
MTQENPTAMEEVTRTLEEGVRNFFTSEGYVKYLKTMSRFHHYSINNSMLIALQKPDATLVAGYVAWQRKFGRNVRRGEKGIRIISPIITKVRTQRAKTDPETGKPVLDAEGNPQKEWVETRQARYQVSTVFDVSQTEGRPIPALELKDLTGSVKDYDILLPALKKAAGVPVRFGRIEEPGVRGCFNRGTGEILLQENMSQAQTVKTLVHEIAHAWYHADRTDPEAGQMDRSLREVQAESMAFVIASHYGLDTGEYSFPYIALWSGDKSMWQLKSSLSDIRRGAAGIIDATDRYAREQIRQREAEWASEQIAEFYASMPLGDFRDASRDPEQEVRNIQQNLLAGHAEKYMGPLQMILEQPEEFSPKEQETAKVLLERLQGFAAPEPSPLPPREKPDPAPAREPVPER